MEIKAFKPSSEMTFSTVQADRDRLVKYFRDARGKVIKFDLSEVTHCDSAGLALLIEAKRLSTQKTKFARLKESPRRFMHWQSFVG